MMYPIIKEMIKKVGVSVISSILPVLRFQTNNRSPESVYFEKIGENLDNENSWHIEFTRRWGIFISYFSFIRTPRTALHLTSVKSLGRRFMLYLNSLSDARKQDKSVLIFRFLKCSELKYIEFIFHIIKNIIYLQQHLKVFASVGGCGTEIWQILCEFANLKVFLPSFWTIGRITSQIT